ncbi:hypothetical protein F3Y22_tig00116939pilonHSYRG00320 [Hibiscus syriacus]|uniref:Uncharacterized protein n=1 Tax=Hibiscus syriacus TaxID=106335 RepID=A0A6A2X2A5_HIBSY|nr:hypothetical protein F3Y22_tig00116939pilonHSYRG00320 [Hibiscus syriacus]
MLPMPNQGHLKPMLKLAELLCHASFQVTFINTEYVNETFVSSIDIQAFSRRFPGFRDAAKPALFEVMVSLMRQQQPPTCIIADGIMSCSAIDAGKEFGAPVLAFRTSSACCIWTYFHLSMLIQEGEVPLQG